LFSIVGNKDSHRAFYIYFVSMITDEVKALPLAEKMRLMEVLWLDLRDRFEQMDLSESQKARLDQRRVAAERGESRLHDWDAVKSSFGRR
jgi:putative addiction module component (TIGR02574 family)